MFEIQLAYSALAGLILLFLLIGMICGLFGVTYALHRERRRKNIPRPYKLVLRDIMKEDVYKKK